MVKGRIKRCNHLKLDIRLDIRNLFLNVGLIRFWNNFLGNVTKVPSLGILESRLDEYRLLFMATEMRSSPQ